MLYSRLCFTSSPPTTCRQRTSTAQSLSLPPACWLLPASVVTCRRSSRCHTCGCRATRRHHGNCSAIPNAPHCFGTQTSQRKRPTENRIQTLSRFSERFKIIRSSWKRTSNGLAILMRGEICQNGRHLYVATDGSKQTDNPVYRSGQVLHFEFHLVKVSF